MFQLCMEFGYIFFMVNRNKKTKINVNVKPFIQCFSYNSPVTTFFADNPTVVWSDRWQSNSYW